MSEERLDETAYLYVLDLLEPAERAAFDRRIEAEEPTVLEALAEAEDLAGALPEALPPVAPRPEAKRALMARIEQSTQPRSTGAAPAVPLRANAPRERAAAPVWAWAAIALLTFGLGAALTATFQRDANGPERDRLTRALAEAEAQTRAALAERDRLATELAATPLSPETPPTPRTPNPTLRAIDPQRLAALESEKRQLQGAVASLETRLAEQTRLAEARDARLLAEQDARRKERERLTADATRAATLAAANASANAAANAAAKATALEAANEALALVRAPDVGVVDLFGTSEGTATSASVFWDRGLTRCYLHARALPELEAGEAYALWLTFESGATIHVDDLDVNDRGIGSLFADLPRGHGEVLRTFITREPGTERARPNGETVLAERPRSSESPLDPRRKYRRRS